MATTREHERTIVWGPSAELMLDDAIAAISAGSRVAGANFVADVRRTVQDVLERYAHDGRVVPELGMANVREVTIGQYRLQYKLEPDTVEIVALACCEPTPPPRAAS